MTTATLICVSFASLVLAVNSCIQAKNINDLKKRVDNHTDKIVDLEIDALYRNHPATKGRGNSGYTTI